MMDIDTAGTFNQCAALGASGITPGFTASVVLKRQQLAVAILSNRGAFMGVQRAV